MVADNFAMDREEVDVEDVDGLRNQLGTKKGTLHWKSAVNRLPAFFVAFAKCFVDSRMSTLDTIAQATVNEGRGVAHRVSIIELAVLSTIAHTILARVSRTIDSFDTRLSVEFRSRIDDPLSDLVRARKYDRQQCNSLGIAGDDRVVEVLCQVVADRLGRSRSTPEITKTVQRYLPIFLRIIEDTMLADVPFSQSPRTAIETARAEEAMLGGCGCA